MELYSGEKFAGPTILGGRGSRCLLPSNVVDTFESMFSNNLRLNGAVPIMKIFYFDTPHTSLTRHAFDVQLTSCNLNHMQKMQNELL